MRFRYLFPIVLLSFLAVFFFTVHQSPQLKNEDPDQVKNSDRSGAYQAMEFWTASRAYPYSDIPAGKYYSAFEHSRKLIKPLLPSINSLSEWEFIGPVNLSGRTIALEFNPLNGNTIWAGSASGGLWRSQTAGVGGNWERISTGFPVLGVSSIAISPTDSNLMYIGTGEVYNYAYTAGGTVIRTTRGSYGIGILKSTDGGHSWTKTLDWSYSDQQGVQVVKINPLNPNTVWAGTTSGIYRTTDAGQNWELLMYAPTMDLVISSTDTTKVMASCGNFGYPGLVLRTITNGFDWEVTSAPYYTGKTLLGMSQSNPDIVYASIADSTTGAGYLCKTTDFGLTWSTQQSYPLNASLYGVQGWYSHFVAVHPTNPDIIVHAGVPITKSTNAGISFSNASGSYSDHHAFAIHPTNPNILYVANDDGVYRSTNFGTSYTYVSSGLNTGQFYNGFSNSQSDSLLGIGQVQDHIPGYLFSGSFSWARSARDECGWTGINPMNDNIMYAASRDGGAIYQSTDRGVSFGSGKGLSGTGCWNSPFIISPSNPNILYFGKQKIFKTTDASQTWFATNGNNNLDGNPTLSMGMSATNPDTVYVGTAPLYSIPHIFRTINGGVSWSDITGSLPPRYPNDIAVDPSNSRNAYIAFGGYGAGHFFRTTDAGTTWTNITGILPDIPGTAVLVDPQFPNIIYAGTDIGVYISTDYGTTWNTFTEGLPEAVLVSDLSYTASNRTLRVTTYGNSIFERKLPQSFPTLSLTSPNGGEAWEATSTQIIQWDVVIVPTVSLEYSTDNGSSWTPIVSNLPSTPPSYAWEIPVMIASNVKVRISSSGNPGLNDESDAPFMTYFDGVFAHTNTSWNLISLPLNVPDRTKAVVYPTAISSAFSFNNGYSQQDTLTFGIGYWIKFPSAQIIPIRGNTVSSSTVHLEKGWNLIGTISTPLLASSLSTNPSGIISGNIFGYNQGYSIAETLETGKGYWVNALDTGAIILEDTPILQAGKRVNTLQDYNSLTISNDQGFSQTLYFGIAEKNSGLPELQLPPAPPSGIPDARFKSNSIAVIAERDKKNLFDILTQSLEGKLELRWKIKSSSEQGWNVTAGTKRQTMTGEGSMSVILSKENILLEYTAESLTHSNQPTLLSNYPNPFNPETEIAFEIPNNEFVNLTIYDPLGKEIATLINETVSAGIHTISWNAGNNPSGIYIYKLQTNSAYITKKMVLLK